MENYLATLKDRSSISHRIISQQLFPMLPYVFLILGSVFLPGFKTSRKLSAVWMLLLLSCHCSSCQGKTLSTAGKIKFISRVIRTAFRSAEGLPILCPIPFCYPTAPPRIPRLGTPSFLSSPTFCISPLDGNLEWPKKEWQVICTLPFDFDDLEPSLKEKYPVIKWSLMDHFKKWRHGTYHIKQIGSLPC